MADDKPKARAKPSLPPRSLYAYPEKKAAPAVVPEKAAPEVTVVKKRRGRPPRARPPEELAP